MTGHRTLEVASPGERVLLVTLNRREVANAMSTELGHELTAVFEDVAAAPSRHGAVVLTGAGDRVFCAGADLKERRGMSEESWVDQHLVFERMMRAIIDCPVPTIAAVNGAAYAGGCEIMLSCDFAYASRTARFALTEITIGIMPGGAGTQTLPRTIGERRAKELILTGRPFSAEEALRWGVVNRLCEPAELLPAALATAAALARTPGATLREAKKALRAQR
jgi:enoyl-CoA hydratase/carnithine racemase